MEKELHYLSLLCNKCHKRAVRDWPLVLASSHDLYQTTLLAVCDGWGCEFFTASRSHFLFFLQRIHQAAKMLLKRHTTLLSCCSGLSVAPVSCHNHLKFSTPCWQNQNYTRQTILQPMIISGRVKNTSKMNT